MEHHKDHITAMLRRDLGMLCVFLVVLWGINGFILMQSLPLVGHGASWVLLVPFLSAMLVLTGTLIKVGVHLRQNQEVLYGEELYYRDLAQDKVREQL